MKITPKQFELFKSETLKWIDFFGLKEWQVLFLFKKIDNRAEIHYDTVSGIATVILNNDWNEIDKSLVTALNIRKTAFHEVCELLLCRLTNMVGQRFSLASADVEEETHRIIRTLENTLWKS